MARPEHARAGDERGAVTVLDPVPDGTVAPSRAECPPWCPPARGRQRAGLVLRRRAARFPFGGRYGAAAPAAVREVERMRAGRQWTRGGRSDTVTAAASR